MNSPNEESPVSDTYTVNLTVPLSSTRSETLRELRVLLAAHPGLPQALLAEVARVERRVAGLEECAAAVAQSVGVKMLSLERVSEFLTHARERFSAGPKWQTTEQPGLEVQWGVTAYHQRSRVVRIRFWGWLSQKEAERRAACLLRGLGLERAGAWTPAGNGSFEAPVLPPPDSRK